MASSKPWLANWPTDVPQKLKYPKIPLFEILRETAKKYPQRIALSYFDKEIAYLELDQLSEKFAVSLSRLGVKKGDRVALFLPNIPQFIIAYFGILKAGAILTTMSPLHKEREVEHQLGDSEAKVVVVLDSLCQIVENVKKKTKLLDVIVTGLMDYASNSDPQKMVKLKPHTHSFLQLLRETTEQPLKTSIDPAEDLAALQYTGGTTGTAKGAMLTHMNLLSNTIAFSAWIRGETEKENFLTALPLFHIYGMTTSMNVPVFLAAKMVLLPKFDPIAALQAIQTHKVTVFCGVPTMYVALLNNPELARFDLTSIRVCISGASPLPPQVQKKFMEITGGFLAEGYGLTEASPVTHCTPVDRTMKMVKTGSIGLPLPDTDAKILDLVTGEIELAPEETGELVVKGPQVMKGYWKRPGETSYVLRNGWLYTGDIGKIDRQGYFYITDRKKDLIKYKDYSVYPREIEDVLYEYSGVKLCAVIGKPDPLVGESPKAFIVLKEGSSATEEEIMKFVKEKVAPYKAIREVEFRKELPLSSAGKVLRRVLQDEESQKAAETKE